MGMRGHLFERMRLRNNQSARADAADIDIELGEYHAPRRVNMNEPIEVIIDLHHRLHHQHQQTHPSLISANYLHFMSTFFILGDVTLTTLFTTCSKLYSTNVTIIWAVFSYLFLIFRICSFCLPMKLRHWCIAILLKSQLILFIFVIPKIHFEVQEPLSTITLTFVIFYWVMSLLLIVLYFRQFRTNSQ